MNQPLPQVRELSALLSGGDALFGQVCIHPDLTLHHHQDFPHTEGLEIFTHPEAAAEIVKWDSDGNYRPLKTAPNLKQGWLLRLSSVPEVKLALDFFYPAMWGTWLAWKNRDISTFTLRETLGRQTGMYRVTQKISDAYAREVIAATCNTEHGCLRKILWEIAPGVSHAPLPKEKFSPEPSEGEIPLLCAESCNLLVAAMRKKVKDSAP